ncbi:MAG: hypothetical protein IPK00_05240 [Deltaproteobacteria bacterium]|nr:hypothetical protein [Deltaproteobacteria bacterium]
MSTGVSTPVSARVLAAVQTILSLAYPLLIVWALAYFPPRRVAGVVLGLLALRGVLHVLRRRMARGTQGVRGARVPWSLALPVASVALVSAATAIANDPLGLLLAPVFVNAALLAAFAFSLRREPIVETLARLQVERLAPAEVRYCRRVTLVWCGFFVLNGGVGFVLAWTRSLEAWAFYTGFLSYVLMGLLFAGEYVYRHARFRRYEGGPADRLLSRVFPPRQTPERVGLDARGGDRARTVLLEVPTGLACWRGHFPGQPMLPGVVQVDWVLRELERWRGAPPQVLALEGLKFKQPVLPGEALVLRLEGEPASGSEAGGSPGESIDFRFVRGEEEVSRGRVRLGLGDAVAGRRSAVGEREGLAVGGQDGTPPWPAPAELLVHADPMVWLRGVEAHDERETRCLASVDDLGAFRDPEGGVGAHAALEWMAQAVAVHAGLERRARGEGPTLGLLLGSKHVRFARPAYTRGEQFRVVALRGWGGEQGASSFDCRVESLDGRVRVAEARLSCFVPGDEAPVPGLAAAHGGSGDGAVRGEVGQDGEDGEASLARSMRRGERRTPIPSGGAR